MPINLPSILLLLALSQAERVTKSHLLLCCAIAHRSIEVHEHGIVLRARSADKPIFTPRTVFIVRRME